MTLLSSSLAVLLMATLLEARGPKHYELEGYTFAQYQRDFDKRYKSTEEAAQRQRHFEETLAIIKQHNEGGHSWKMGVNQFTDRTKEERQRINGNLAGSMHPTFKSAMNNRPHVKKYVMSGKPLPAAVDWRNQQVLTAVKDQGGCGDCWAFAATETIESHAALQTKELWSLSPQQINSCTPNPNQCGGTGGCAGNIVELAFDYVKKTPLAQEWTYPYTSYGGLTGDCNSNKADGIVSLDGYVAVESNNQTQVMDAVAHAGPLAISVDASNWFSYETGVFTGCGDFQGTPNHTTIDHAVQMIGYGYDAAADKNYWLIRNSWSPGWGEAGYIRLFKAKDKPACGWNYPNSEGDGCAGGPAKSWVCGECAVLFDTLYPKITNH